MQGLPRMQLTPLLSEKLAHERTWETFSGRGAFITAFTFCWDLHVQTQLSDLMITELDSFFEEFALTAVACSRTNLGNILRTWCIYHSIHILLGLACADPAC